MIDDSDIIQRTEDEQKRSIEIHDLFRNELLKRQLSNTENYDKSILTLSSAGLTISLTFLNYITPFQHTENLQLLKLSWFCFLISIIVSLVAYLVSNAAITKQLKIAEDYYINKKQSAASKKNYLSIINHWLNFLVGLSFIVAITTTLFFVILNLKSETKEMTEKTFANDSAGIPLMQKVAGEGVKTNSAQIPNMQAAPGVLQSSQPSSTQAQQAQSSESKK